MRPKIQLPHIDEIITDYIRGKSIKRLAMEHETTRDIVRRNLVDAGVRIRGRLESLQKENDDMMYAELGLQFRWSVEYPDVPLWMRVSEYLTEMHLPEEMSGHNHGTPMPFTDIEKQYIVRNMDKSVFRLAEELDRNVNTVRRWKQRLSESGYSAVSGSPAA
jgi:hypothetical protein